MLLSYFIIMSPIPQIRMEPKKNCKYVKYFVLPLTGMPVIFSENPPKTYDLFCILK